MANRPYSGQPEIGTPADDDFLLMLDTSEPTASNKNKRGRVSDFLARVAAFLNFSAWTTEIVNARGGQATLDARLDNQDSQFSSLDARLDTAETDITNLEAADVALDSRLDTAEADITALEAADVALDARLDTAEADIVVLETKTAPLSIVANLEVLTSSGSSYISPLAFIDEYGNVVAAFDSTGALNLYSRDYHIQQRDFSDDFAITDSYGSKALAVSGNGVELSGAKFAKNDEYDFAITDSFGNVIFGVKDGVAQGGSGVSSSQDVINLEESHRRQNEPDVSSQRPTAKYNHVIAYGQSLMQANEGWPHLTRVAVYGNVMLGNSNRPASNTDPAFVPLGTSTFQPLVASTANGDGSALLTEPQIAALTPGDQNKGESPDISALNQLKKLYNDKVLLENDSGKLFLTTNCAVGGQSIGELSKNAVPELFQRIQDAISISNTARGADSIKHVATLYNQGEADYSLGTTKTAYKTALKTLRSDIDLEVTTVYGTQKQAAFFTYQTGGSYANDSLELAIATGQFELSLEESAWYLAMPAYPYTDEGGHLTPNGYRAMGCKYGQVLNHVLIEGKRWRPTSPVKLELSGQSILVHCHVPKGVLQFKDTYVGNSATMYINKGFRVSDSAGNVPINSVAIVGGSIVSISLDRLPDYATCKVWYADKSIHNGNGNVCDTDDFKPMYNYEYDGSRGMESDENIAALVNKPYPLQNWMIGFCLPLGWQG
jgi:hypothetical protein